MGKLKTKILLSLIIAIVITLQLASAVTLKSFNSNPQELVPGEKVDLEITIENQLEEDVKNIIVTLDLSDVPFAPYQSSNQKTINELEEDDDEDLDFDLLSFSDAESGTYKIPVKISYQIENKTEQIEGLISLIINASPKIEISLDEGVLIKSMNNEIVIGIINSGLGHAKLLTMEVEDTLDINVIGSGRVYIGDLDSDDLDSSEFTIKVSENSPSMVNIPVKIEYRDSQNTEFRETKNLNLKAYTEKEALELGLISQNNTLTIVFVIIILIILFFVYRNLRKRLKKRKEK